VFCVVIELGELTELGWFALAPPDQAHENDVGKHQHTTLDPADVAVQQRQQGECTCDGGEDRVLPDPPSQLQRTHECGQTQAGRQHRHVGPDRVTCREARPVLGGGQHSGQQLLGLRPREQDADGQHRDAEALSRGRGILDEQLCAADEQHRRAREQQESDHDWPESLTGRPRR
jgi:hypothetical protein